MGRPSGGGGVHRNGIPEMQNERNVSDGDCFNFTLIRKSSGKILKLPFGTPDHFRILTYRQRFTQRNPECLEHCLALVVIVLPGKHDMCRDAGAGAQAVKEMLKDICRDRPDGLVPEGAGKDKVSPAPAVEYDRRKRLIHRDDGMGEPLYPMPVADHLL